MHVKKKKEKEKKGFVQTLCILLCTASLPPDWLIG